MKKNIFPIFPAVLALTLALSSLPALASYSFVQQLSKEWDWITPTLIMDEPAFLVVSMDGTAGANANCLRINQVDTAKHAGLRLKLRSRAAARLLKNIEKTRAPCASGTISKNDLLAFLHEHALLDASDFSPAAPTKKNDVPDVKTIAAGPLASGKLTNLVFEKMQLKNSSTVISPWSIAEAATAVALAQDEQHQKTLPLALQTTLSSDDFFNSMQKSHTLQLTSGAPMHSINYAWLAKGSKPVKQFKTDFSTILAGEIKSISFKDPDAAAQQINDAIAKASGGKLDNVMSGKDLVGAQAVLTNTVYFKDQWATRFDPALTKPMTFHAADGSQSEVPTMQLTGKFSFATADGWAMVELPFKTANTSLILYLPPANADPSMYMPSEVMRQTLQTSGMEMEVHLQLPKLKLLGPKLELEKSLPELFGKPMTKLQQGASVPISKVLHQAIVEWDESGAEAAASTAVVGAKGGIVELTREIKFDRPFAFFISRGDDVLFAGQVFDLK